MKKRVSIILVAVLVCMLGTALATEGFTIAEIQSGEVFSSIEISDAVYLLSTQKNLYALDTKTQQATPVPMHNANPEYEQIPESALAFHEIAKDEAIPDWLQKEASLIDMLFGDGAVLYGVNELNGTLYRVDIAKGGATLHAISQLDFFSGIDKEPMPTVQSGVACNGSLYLMMNLSADGAQASAYRFDIATGAREPLKRQSTIVEITRYRDNHLLLLEKSSDSQWQITDFDAATNTLSTLLESSKLDIASENVSGLLYDSWRDRILLQSGKALLAFASESSYEVVVYLPPTMFYCRGLLADGLLIQAGESIQAWSTLQQKQTTKPLQVASFYLENWMEDGFAKAYPEIVVNQKQINEYEAVSFLAEQIAIQSDEIDIFEVPIGSASQKVIEKGYYYPLNQSESILNKVNGYRPFFQQTLMKGSDIAAIPATTEQYTLAYSKYALAQLGLTAADMPSTFMELMDFLLAWDERVGDAAEQEGITPFGDGLTNMQLKIDLSTMLMDQYYVLMAKDASAIPLYEADMGDLLDKLSLVCATIPEAPEKEPYVTTNQPFQHIRLNTQPSYLFSVYSSFLPGRRNFSNGEAVSDFVPISLTLPSQSSPIQFFDGTLLIVNPYSSQKEQAIQWLSYFVDYLPAADAATFEQDAAPVTSATYTAMKEYYTAETGRLEERIQAAEGPAKSDLEAQLEAMQSRIQQIEQIKWDVSDQTLKDYEQFWLQSTILWTDSYSADAFAPTYAAYIADGLSGKTVAHEFFATHEMILKESR